MRLFEFLIMHARGQGKTHSLAQLVKAVDGTLIVRNEREAARVRGLYGIRAYPYTVGAGVLAGRRLGITYVDPDAVGIWVNALEHDIALLKKHIAELEDRLAEAE